VGGNPEIVEDGVSGLLVPPRDSTRLAEAMITLLSDPALAFRFGQVGKKKIAEGFSLERSIRAVERLYQDLVEGRGLGTLDLAPQSRSSATIPGI
jgi:glycosyltransferase involved in cell wall biosynthesis